MALERESEALDLLPGPPGLLGPVEGRPTPLAEVGAQGELTDDERRAPDFGVFEVKGRAARRAQNPRTLQKVQVPAKRVVKFKVGRVLRERISEEPEELPRSPRAAATPAPVQPPKPQPPTPPTPKPPPSNSPF